MTHTPLDRLCWLLYNRPTMQSDFAGGENAKVLRDAYEEITRLRMQLRQAEQNYRMAVTRLAELHTSLVRP